MGSRVLQSVLLTLTGSMLLWKVGSGVLPVYVHVRYTGLIAGTGLALVVLGLVAGWLGLARSPSYDTHEHEHEHARLQWRSPAVLALLLPVVLGLFVPVRALGTAAIENKGLGRPAGLPAQAAASQELANGILDTTTWSMLDWINALTYQPDNPRLQGQPIQVIGFVWRPEGLATDQFIVSRFVVTCCVADGLALGLPVIWTGASDLKNDAWVRVHGKLGLAEVRGKQEAVILAETVDSIPQPANPYLTP